MSRGHHYHLFFFFFLIWSIPPYHNDASGHLSYCWGVIDHRVSLKVVGRKEVGSVGKVWGRGRGTKGRVRGSHKLQLLLVSFSPSWTPLTFHSGASWSQERFNWMDSLDVFGVWVMKKGGGGKEGWILWWKQRRGGGNFPWPSKANCLALPRPLLELDLHRAPVVWSSQSFPAAPWTPASEMQHWQPLPRYLRSNQ